MIGTGPSAPAKPYESFVINLDRRAEKLAEFYRWNADCGLTIQRFAAVDGATPAKASSALRILHSLRQH